MWPQPGGSMDHFARARQCFFSNGPRFGTVGGKRAYPQAMLPRLAISAVPLMVLVGCAQAASSPAATPQAGAQAAAVAKHSVPDAAPKAPLTWADLTPETFAKAKAQRRFIVLDGAAEWCHWCHVMEATTYHDPEVQKLLEEKFIAVKVDIDSRPDIEERYGDYGWPATVIFSPDAQELGKFKGYLPPEEFIEILRKVVALGDNPSSAAAEEKTAPIPDTPLPEDEIAWRERTVELELADWWDDEQGGWGHMQKASCAWDNAFALARAAAGDQDYRKKVLFALDQQAKIIDPVWGGIYQYSAATDWDHPHFEKLMAFQAGAVDNYARAYILTRDSKYLDLARKVAGFVDRFMTDSNGGFYTTEDADLNAHDPSKPFLDGHQYYALDEPHRLALGLPRIDTHEYGRENGLAIAAYATLFEATQDPQVLARARRAAEFIIATHANPRGGITHDITKTQDREPDKEVLFLSDNASFAWGLVRLHDVTHEDKYLNMARMVLDCMVKEMQDMTGGGFFSSTLDPNAAGVLSRRLKPVEDNDIALLALAKMARVTKDAGYRRAIDRALRGVVTPDAIRARGRFLGDLLLAFDETKDVRGAPPPAPAPAPAALPATARKTPNAKKDVASDRK
jgi:uncharacterized protein